VILVLAVAFTVARGVGGGSSHPNPNRVWYQRGYTFGSTAAADGWNDVGDPMGACVNLQLGINGNPWSSEFQMPDG
jgi:hypothetical protein